MSLTSARFLMAQLHLGSLAKMSNKTDVHLALERLPKKLDDTYAEAIKRITSQDEEDVQLAKRTLMWISCAKRPLSIIELQHALATKPEAKELDPDSLPEKDVIVEVCSGLVAIDPKSEIIRLVHYTTQDYLVRVRAELFATAEIDMTFCCLTYLLFNKSARISELGKPVSVDSIEKYEDELKAAYPFWSYAVGFWGFHAQRKAQYDPRTQDLILQLLKPTEVTLGITRSYPLRKKWNYYQDLYDVPGMHTAAYFDLTGLVDTLLDRGALVDAKDDHLKDCKGLTALHCAALWGHVATLRLLLDRGALIEMSSGFGETALMMAAHEGHTDSVELLLERGADVDKQHFYRETALWTAASRGYCEIVELLLENGADIHDQDINGGTALWKAAAASNHNMVELLLKKGAGIDSPGYNGETAMFEAAITGHQDMVELLLRKGADIDSRNYDGETALYATARFGEQTMVELLLEKGADVDGRDIHGRTALRIAAQTGRLSVVELLLEKGADVNSRNHEGETALYVAASDGQQTMVELLLEKGADVDGRDIHGRTALWIAAQTGRPSVMELLLEKGADVNARDTGREPLLHGLVWSGVESDIEVLLRYGADVDARSRRSDGKTALHLAADLGKKAKAQMLIGAGADLEAKVNYKGLQFTASDIAKQEGHIAVFELLQKAQEQRKTLPTRNLTQTQNIWDESDCPLDWLWAGPDE